MCVETMECVTSRFWDPFGYKTCPLCLSLFFLSFSHCVSVSVCDRVCLRDCVKSHVVYTYMERMPNTSTTHKYQKVVMLISSNWIYKKNVQMRERERKREPQKTNLHALPQTKERNGNLDAPCLPIKQCHSNLQSLSTTSQPLFLNGSLSSIYTTGWFA